MEADNKKKITVLFVLTSSRLIVLNTNKIKGLDALLIFINKALTNRSSS
jgi:hypothetical protein